MEYKKSLKQLKLEELGTNSMLHILWMTFDLRLTGTKMSGLFLIKNLLKKIIKH